MVTERRVQRLLRYLNSRQADLRLFLDDVHDPHNMAAILRTADAAGLFYVDYARIGDAKVQPSKKITQGSDRWLAIEQIAYDRRIRHLTTLRDRGYQIVATTLSDEAAFYSSIDYTRPTVIVMGNEKEGVSAEVADLADHHIIIPMHGMAQSLNVSVAAAVILYEAERQRRRAGMFETPTLSQAEIKRWLENWIERDGLSKTRGRIDPQKWKERIKETQWPDYPKT